MTNTPAEQSRAYREYFEIVRSFNSTNAEYTTRINEAVSQRQTAIRQAIETHMNPLLSKVRVVQIISGIVSAFSFLSFCCGCSAVQSASNSYYQTAQAAQQGQIIVGLIILFSMGIGAVGGIALVWTTSKISELTAKVRAAQQSPPPNL